MELPYDCWVIVFRYLTAVEQSRLRLALCCPQLPPIMLDGLQSSWAQDISRLKLKIVTKQIHGIQNCGDDIMFTAPYVTKINITNMRHLDGELLLSTFINLTNVQLSKGVVLDRPLPYFRAVDCYSNLVTFLHEDTRSLIVRRGNNFDTNLLDLTRFEQLNTLELHLKSGVSMLLLPGSITELTYMTKVDNTQFRYIYIGGVDCSQDMSSTSLKKIILNRDIIPPICAVHVRCVNMLANVSSLNSLRSLTMTGNSYTPLNNFPRLLKELILCHYNDAVLERVKDEFGDRDWYDESFTLTMLLENLEIIPPGLDNTIVYVFYGILHSKYQFIEFNPKTKYVKCLMLQTMQCIRMYPDTIKLHIICNDRVDGPKLCDIMYRLREYDVEEIVIENYIGAIMWIPLSVSKITLKRCSITIDWAEYNITEMYIIEKRPDDIANKIYRLPHSLQILVIRDATPLDVNKLPDSVEVFITVNECKIQKLPTSIRRISAPNLTEVNCGSQIYRNLSNIAVGHCPGLLQLYRQCECLVYFNVLFNSAAEVTSEYNSIYGNKKVAFVCTIRK